MLLRCKCPGCGNQKEYIAEEVGATTDCQRCGNRFTLQPNHGRVAWHIIAATLAVMGGVGGLGVRMYLRAQRVEAKHQHHATRQAERHQTPLWGDSDDD